MILAQSTSYSSTDSMLLSVRRWIGQSTLSHPSPVSSGEFHSSYWLFALLILMILGLIFQGPGRFLSGLLNWSLASAAVKSGLKRLRERLVLPLALVGLLLGSWTTLQFLNYSSPTGVSDLQLAIRTKTIPVLSLELGFLAALVPFRDLTSLADAWPMVLAATILSFHYSNKMQFVPRSVSTPDENRARFYSQLFMILGSIWLVYRLVVGFNGDGGGLPLYSGIFIDAIIEPFFMLFMDCVLFAWILTELRDAPKLDSTEIAPRLPDVIGLLPAVMVVNFILMPARYIAHGIWIFWDSLSGTSFSQSSEYATMTNYFIWILGEGLIYMQLIAFPCILLAGGCLSGSVRQSFKISRLLLRDHAATILLILIFQGFLNIVGVALINSLVLSHPTESWVLLAADSYSHYFTLFTGLLLLATMINLGAGCELEMIAAEAEKSISAATSQNDFK